MHQQSQQSSASIDVIVKLLGTITGAIAGVSALLSVAGFLLLRAHANLLGISSVLYHTIGDYLYEGGVFFLSTLIWALPTLIIGNIYGRILLGAIVLLLLGKRFANNAELISKVKKLLKLEKTLRQSWIHWICIVVAIFLFLLCIYQLLPSPEAKDLLFPAGNQLEIKMRVSEDGLTKLENSYVHSILYILFSCLILWGIQNLWQGIKDNISFIGLLFLYLLLLLQLILLSVKYGQTVYPNDYHKVDEIVLDKKLDGKIPQSENIWLLNETGEELVLYFGDLQKVFLMQKSQILNIVIKERENIFKGR
jgi:hypothetical protein